MLAFAVDIPVRVRGLIQAFGAGVLFGAVAYELVEEGTDLNEVRPRSLG